MEQSNKKTKPMKYDKSLTSKFYSLLALGISLISFTISLLTFLDTYNYVDLSNREHVLEMSILGVEVSNDIIVYTILFRNSGDYVEDIVDVRSYVRVQKPSDNYPLRADQSYCFAPFSLTPNEHKVIRYSTKYDLTDYPDFLVTSDHGFHPYIEVDVAGDKGIISEIVELGTMIKNPDGRFKAQIENQKRFISFQGETRVTTLTSYPKDKKYLRNILCPGTGILPNTQ